MVMVTRYPHQDNSILLGMDQRMKCPLSKLYHYLDLIHHYQIQSLLQDLAHWHRPNRNNQDHMILFLHRLYTIFPSDKA